MARDFFRTSPALPYGLSLLLGVLFALKSAWALLPLLLLCKRHTFYTIVICFLVPLPILFHVYTFPPSNTPVEGIFTISSARQQTSYGKGWVYRGSLQTKKGKLRCQIYTKTPYALSWTYSITGITKTREGIFYTVKTKEAWQPAKPATWSLLPWRQNAQQRLKNYIQRVIPHRRSADFLCGMTTGQLEDPLLLREFGQLGLSHIMAISGFHFALLVLFFHLALCFALPPKWEALVLIALSTFYLLFVGDSPSVQRAWILTTLFFAGRFFGRPTYPLNSLGVALICAILFNPLSATTLSFQLSFLATAGIMLFYRPMNQLLNLLLPKKKLCELLCDSFLYQHLYLLGSLVREGLALTVAVHIAIWPLLVTCFHALPLNSFLYNLFFPFFASLALFLFLIGTLLPTQWLTTLFCRALLTIPQTPPIALKTFYFATLPSWVVPLYFTGVLLALLCLKKEKREQRLSVTDGLIIDHA